MCQLHCLLLTKDFASLGGLGALGGSTCGISCASRGRISSGGRCGQAVSRVSCRVSSLLKLPAQLGPGSALQLHLLKIRLNWVRRLASTTESRTRGKRPSKSIAFRDKPLPLVIPALQF